MSTKDHKPFKQCQACNKLTGGKEEPTFCLHCGSAELEEPSDELPFGCDFDLTIDSLLSDEFVEDLKTLDPNDEAQVAEFSAKYPLWAVSSSFVCALTKMNEDGVLPLNYILDALEGGVKTLKTIVEDVKY